MNAVDYLYKQAEILSRGSKRLFRAPSASTPSEREYQKRYGKTVSHPSPIQNKYIKNYPVTGADKPEKVASFDPAKIAVTASSVFRRLINPSGKKYLRSPGGRFTTREVINYLKGNVR